MNKIFSGIPGMFCGIVMMASAPSATAAMAALDSASITLGDVRVERSESFLNCGFTMKFNGIDIPSNKELRLNPVIVGADGTEAPLPALIVAGRNRYLQAMRHEELSDSLKLYRFREGMSIPYSTQLAYQPWMETSNLVIRERVAGCCNETSNEYLQPVEALDFRTRTFMAVPLYIVPTAEAVKTRELRGRAFVDFPVNRTEINPDYRNNHVELAKIRASIDSVRNDRDVTITALSIKGFASPEGSWNNNVRLAKGRTEALKTYVETLYHFEPGFITTSYEPEDWDGLREWVEKSNIENRDGILSIINSSLAPDPRDAKIRSTYPKQYAFLLANVYPALRHSDYKIDYTIRSYSDPKEIIEVLYTRPQNLSLQEFFTAASTLEPGSQTYNDLFETAVRLYPDSEVANLNAASSAIMRGDYEGAARYLDKAGEAPEAIYNRGIISARQGDYETALGFFERAAMLRVADAPAAIEQVRGLMK